MERQQPAEDLRSFVKGFESTLVELGAAVEREHQPRHEQRPKGQTAVLGRVAVESARLQALGQHQGLLEGKTKAFSCNRVHRSRRITNQGNIPTAYAFQFARSRKRALFGEGNGPT